MKTAVKIAENMYWVGAIDWNLRTFHGYETSRGSTYNAYIIIDDKITLIDTVKKQFADEMLERISSIVDASKIDYIVSNHAEPDHAGSILDVLAVAKNAKVITSSPSGERALKQIFPEDTLPLQAVKTGESLKLGKNTLDFIQTPMVHWPDNMVTYCKEQKVLFSNDAFGQHYATARRFDDEVCADELFYEAKKYFANIVMPYSNQAKKATSDVKTLDIKVIATSHGIIWRKQIKEILDLYTQMSEGIYDKTAVIVYDTMWHSTEKIAHALLQAFSEKGYCVRMRDLATNNYSDIMTEILESSYVAIGSSIQNNQILPPIAGFLTYLKGMLPKGKKYIAFGSYGWSGKPATMLKTELTNSKFDVVLDPIEIANTPSKAQLEKVRDDLKAIL